MTGGSSEGVINVFFNDFQYVAKMKVVDSDMEEMWEVRPFLCVKCR